METADKLLADLMAQGVIEEATDTKSEWWSPAHFVKIRPSDLHKKCFLVNHKRFQFLSTIMGNKLSSDTWLRASDEVTNGLPGVYKLVNDILIGA